MGWVIDIETEDFRMNSRDPYSAAAGRIVQHERRKKELRWTKAEKAMTNRDFPHRVTVAGPNYFTHRDHFDRFYVWCLGNVGRPCKMTPELRDMIIRNNLPLPDGDPVWMVQSQSRTSRRFYFRDYSAAVAFKMVLL